MTALLKLLLGSLLRGCPGVPGDAPRGQGSIRLEGAQDQPRFG